MGISGCTSCQLGGPEALQAYDRAFEEKQLKKAEEERKALEGGSGQANLENRPIPGAVIGSNINLSA